MPRVGVILQKLSAGAAREGVVFVMSQCQACSHWQSTIFQNEVVRRLTLPTQEFATLVRGSAALKVRTQARLRRAYWERARRFEVMAGLAAFSGYLPLSAETARNRRLHSVSRFFCVKSGYWLREGVFPPDRFRCSGRTYLIDAA